jgi:hypothetical protein
MNLLHLIQHVTPSAQCVIVGEPANANEYATAVTWLDERPQPTWAELEAARPAAETAQANKDAQRNRQAAFASEADPLFFQWQRGEGTEQAWLDKVAEIRERYPYSVD